MKRIILLLAISTILLISCYPPRIIYAVADVNPSVYDDSIDVNLIKGDIISSGGGLSLHLDMDLEISNNRRNCIFIEKNSTLELRMHSTVLKFEIYPDSFIYRLGSNEKEQIHLYFHATDFDHITYKMEDYPSVSKSRTLKEKTSMHKLYLFLDIWDDRGKKIEKCVVLKPIDTKRM